MATVKLNSALNMKTMADKFNTTTGEWVDYPVAVGTYGEGFEFELNGTFSKTDHGPTGTINKFMYHVATATNITFEISGLVKDFDYFVNILDTGDTMDAMGYLLDGNDTIAGSTGDDTIFGFGGNDVLNGGLGLDTMLGGAGNDTYYVNATGDKVSEMTTLTSTTNAGGTDKVISTISYTLGSYVENLQLNTSSAVNGTGNTLNNTIYAGAGNNVLNGGIGTDTLSYAYATSTTTAGVKVTFASTAAQATGISGSDTILNFENLTGSNYADTLTGNTTANILNGLAGNDFIDAGAGNDTVYGGAGNDLIGGTAGNDYLDGGTGTDTVGYLYAGAGVIVNLSTATQQNTVGGGLDTIINFENLNGSNYADTLTGNALTNTINGGLGNDTLYGGLGNDTLAGGTGLDTFVFNTALSTSTVFNKDTITDFNVTDDTIKLENAIFTKLTTVGALNSANFKVGAAADANDFIVYNQTTGVLSYDADGNGTGAAVQIALIGTATHAALTYADFTVI